jgi:hypothetical protein
MLRNLTLLLVSLSLFSACSSSKTTEITRATLAPVVKIYAIDKESVPNKPAYIFSLYNDQRLEFQGYALTEKIGSFTTMMNAAEYSKFVNLIKKANEGHFAYNHSKENIGFDVLYYPLKQANTMADTKNIAQNEQTIMITAALEDLIKYKNWYKKDDAPKIWGEVIPNEFIVTLKAGGSAVQVAKKLNATYGSEAKVCLSPLTHTWLIAFNKGDRKTFWDELKKGEDVITVAENVKTNSIKNLELFDNQELIVQFKQEINIDEWVKTYAKNQMQKVNQVAPNMNYYVVSYNSGTLPAKEMIALIKKDTKVAEIQTNKKVLPRQ